MTHRNLGAGLLTALALAWPVDIAMMPSPASASISTDFSAQRRAPDAPDHLLRIDVVLPVRPGDRVPITVRHAGAGLVPRAIPGVRAELSPQERRLEGVRPAVSAVPRIEFEFCAGFVSSVPRPAGPRRARHECMDCSGAHYRGA